VREIERGMLISEEILRHLVTVLEDRGPADELVPAAAARSIDGDDDFMAADAGFEPTTETDATPAEPEADLEPPFDAAADEAIADDEAEDVPAAEEPVAADTRTEKEPS
jgi:hypothetical protein